MKISFCVFIVFSTLSLSSAQSPSSVLDIDGDFLRIGRSYYVLPVIRGKGGGITLGPTSTGRICPLDVMQENNEVRNGLPTTFIPVNASKDGIISESTDLNIQFPGVTICGQLAVWRLETMNRQWFFTSRGTLGNPGRDTLFNWLKIEKYGGNGYKFVYCPTVCHTCSPICGDIGVVKSDLKSLIVGKEPLMIMFKKA